MEFDRNNLPPFAPQCVIDIPTLMMDIDDAVDTLNLMYEDSQFLIWAQADLEEKCRDFSVTNYNTGIALQNTVTCDGATDIVL
jgi:hypothetical protein